MTAAEWARRTQGRCRRLGRGQLETQRHPPPPCPPQTWRALPGDERLAGPLSSPLPGRSAPDMGGGRARGARSHFQSEQGGGTALGAHAPVPTLGGGRQSQIQAPFLLRWQRDLGQGGGPATAVPGLRASCPHPRAWAQAVPRAARPGQQWPPPGATPTAHPGSAPPPAMSVLGPQTPAQRRWEALLSPDSRPCPLGRTPRPSLPVMGSSREHGAVGLCAWGAQPCAECPCADPRGPRERREAGMGHQPVVHSSGQLSLRPQPCLWLLGPATLPAACLRAPHLYPQLTSPSEVPSGARSATTLQPRVAPAGPLPGGPLLLRLSIPTPAALPPNPGPHAQGGLHGHAPRLTKGLRGLPCSPTCARAAPRPGCGSHWLLPAISRPREHLDPRIRGNVGPTHCSQPSSSAPLGLCPWTLARAPPDHTALV